MRYEVTLPVAGAPTDVAAAYGDVARWPEWQMGLAAVGVLSGERPLAGARTRLAFELPGHAMTMVETLERVDGARYDAVYESGPVTNWCRNSFEADGAGTRWTQDDAWAFDGADADEDDLERFRATTTARMEAFVRWFEASRG